MKTITVVIAFTNTSGGMVHVIIQSVNVNFSYDIDGAKGTDQRLFNLHPGLYTIKVHGLSGGTCSLGVTGDIDLAVEGSCDGPNIYLQEQFIVQ